MSSSDSPVAKKGTIHRQWIIGFIATITVLTYGLQSGWMSPFIIVLQSENSPSGYSLSNYEISWIASGISVLAIISAVIFSYIADAIGRRYTLIMIAIPQIFGFALKLVSAHPICLFVSQAFCGIAGGGVYCVAPIYIKEISQDSLRGVLGSSGILLQSLGITIMYAMGAYIDYYTVLWIVVWLPILNVVALFKVPESPAFLVKKGQFEEATKVMAWLRGVDIDDKEVERDISLTKTELAMYENLPSVSFKSIFTEKSSRRGLGLSFLMIIMLDLGGNYAILAYASVIIRNAGVTIAPDLQTILFPALMTIGSLASALTVEKFGRKPLIILSVIFTGIPLLILGSAILIQQRGGIMPPWLPVLCIGICLFASGQHMPLPFIVMSEMFSIELRSKVLGLLVTFGWLLCAIQTVIFAAVTEYFGMHTLFFFFAFINFIGVIIFWIKMPETKGKTNAQIDKELEEI
ncbi:hypothetical protein MSG28_012693 [Choristoneura fumiferana]|uniref:Uncharacterized protein n=1 Tax=Choristoneura fumiferana TaxID=7141 RepID=A0ACC0JHQ6_CHOFU|nr:hypothetical protein MSG28_012693 [Choristoneura fumiferana]